MQPDLDFGGLNVPAGQSVHEDSARLEKVPPSHSTQEVLVPSSLVLAGHGLHVLLSVVPIVPSGHS